MKAVYKINFPCGHFYIGCTIHTLKTRLAAHLSDPTNNRKMALIYKYELCTASKLMEITEVIYKGANSGLVEKYLIHNNKYNDLCVNGIYPSEKPKSMKYEMAKYAELYIKELK